MVRDVKAKARARFKRRAFLRGLGAATVLSPFVPLLSASGEGPSGPLRLIHFYFPHGTWFPFWQPAQTGSGFDLSPILSPLAAHQDQLLVMSGVRIEDVGIGTDHHVEGPSLLTTCRGLLPEMDFFRDYPPGSGMEDFHYGWNAGPSFDQVIAQRVGGETPFSSLEFGVNTKNPHPGKRVSYAASKMPMSPEPNPHAMFDRLFGAAGMSQEQLDRVRAERTSVLDLVGAEVERMRPRASLRDRDKLDAHLAAIRGIEQGLTTTLPTCEGPAIGEPIDHRRAENMPIVFDRHLDLMASALACDLTRVMTLQFAVGSNDGNVYGWPEVGVTREEHHLISHERTAQGRDDLRKIYTWYMSMLSSFCDRLKAIPEGDGTVFDHTCVVVSSEIGTGWNHSYENIPFLLLGGACGKLRMGRHLDYGGVEHNRLLVSLMQMMGLEDVTTFGDDVGSGPLPDLV